MQEFDYLKELELSFENFIPKEKYLIARLDGRAFHTFTRGMERPFDAGLRNAMADTTKALMEEFGATLGYTQSDEISLIWVPRMDRNERGLIDHPFNGRVQKLSTVMSSFASVEFYKLMAHVPKINSYLGFDCRIYMGEINEAKQSLKFRYVDCVRNAYQLIAQSKWSQKELNGVSIGQIKKMLDFDVEMCYGSEPLHGVYFKKEPARHLVTGEVERTKIVRSDGRAMMFDLFENNNQNVEE